MELLQFFTSEKNELFKHKKTLVEPLFNHLKFRV